MVGVTQRPLLPPLKNKSKTFSNTFSLNNLQDLKFGRDNVLGINSTVYTKLSQSIGCKATLKPYPSAQRCNAHCSACEQAPCLDFAVKSSFLTFGFGVRASLRTTCRSSVVRTLVSWLRNLRLLAKHGSLLAG